MRDCGAVCDVSALVSKNTINHARNLFNSCGLYIPNSTYSWLARNKVIKVRDQIVGCTVLKRAIRKRNIYPIYLPEIYDEFARKLLFRTDKKVPLTDIRALFLSAHLQLPLLTFDGGLLDRLSRYIGIRSLWNFSGGGNRSAQEVQDLYRKLMTYSGENFYSQVVGNKAFCKLTMKMQEIQKENMEATTKAVWKMSRRVSNAGALDFHFLVWNILPIIREYLRQHVLQREIIKELCERTLLLVASHEKLNIT